MGCKCGNVNRALNASEAVCHCRSRAGSRQPTGGGGPLPGLLRGPGGLVSSPPKQPLGRRAGHARGSGTEPGRGRWLCAGRATPGMRSACGRDLAAPQSRWPGVGEEPRVPVRGGEAAGAPPAGPRVPARPSGAVPPRVPSSSVNPGAHTRPVGRCSRQGPAGDPANAAARPLLLPGGFTAPSAPLSLTSGGPCPGPLGFQRRPRSVMSRKLREGQRGPTWQVATTPRAGRLGRPSGPPGEAA